MKKNILVGLLAMAFCAVSGHIQAASKGYVKLYEHSGMQGLSHTINFGNDEADTNWVIVDQGGANFKDKCSSASYKIPAGYRVLLYENTNYSGRAYPLIGTGSAPDLSYMNDKCSSIRWEKN